MGKKFPHRVISPVQAMGLLISCEGNVPAQGPFLRSQVGQPMISHIRPPFPTATQLLSLRARATPVEAGLVHHIWTIIFPSYMLESKSGICQMEHAPEENNQHKKGLNSVFYEE